MDTESTPPVQPAPTPVAPKQNNTIIFILVGIIILLVGLGGGYLIKSQTSPKTPPPTPQAQNLTTPTSATQPTPTPTQSKAALATYTSTKLPNVSFEPYSIQYPDTWTPKDLKNGATDTFTLTKGNLEIKIYQAAMGGSGCVFAGEVPPGPMKDLRSTQYTQVATGSDTVLRRYLNVNLENDTPTYNFCSSDNNTDWGTPTSFGGITYTSTAPFSDTDLEEMDSILKTLQVAK